MTLSDYIIFTTVSELKNMSLASDKLYLTRSAISHAISRIEREIGFPLFIKNTHKVTGGFTHIKLLRYNSHLYHRLF